MPPTGTLAPESELVDESEISEVLDSNEIELVGEFNPEEALNNPRFLTWLDRYPDHEDLARQENYQEVLEQRYRVFEARETAGTEIKDLYRERIARETGVGLEDADLAGVDLYLDEAAIERPQELHQLVANVREFRDLPRQLDAQWEQLQALGSRQQQAERRANLEEDRERRTRQMIKAQRAGIQKLAGASLWARVFNGEQRGKIERDNKLAESLLLKVDRDLAAADQAAAQTDDLEAARAQLQEHYGEVRLRLFAEFQPARGVAERARLKVRERINELAGGDQQGKERAQEYLEQVRGEVGETSFEYVDTLGSEVEEMGLDDEMEAEVKAQIDAAVENMVFDGEPVRNLDQQLQQFLGRSRIGSKQGQAARELVQQTISESLAKTRGARALILRVLLTKYRRTA